MTDTTSAAGKVWLERLRQMSKEDRLAQAFHLTALSLELHRQGLRRRMPEAAERELARASCEALYGRELAQKVYGS